MRAILAIGLAVCACGFDSTGKGSASSLGSSATTGGSDAASGAASSGGNGRTPWRRRLTFADAVVDAGVDDLPFVVVLDADRIDYGLAGANGEGLRFVGADGQTPLPHQIESWDPDDVSFVWVETPRVDPDDSFVWMIVGEPGSPDAAAVWADFEAVWHLGEDPEAIFVDSTGNEHGAFGIGLGPGAQVEGVAGHAVALDGVDNQLEVPSSETLVPVDALTLEAWVRLDTIDTQASRFVFLERDTLFVHVVRETTTQPRFSLRFENVGAFEVGPAYTLATQQWLYLAVTWDRETGQMIFYDGGQQVAATDASAAGDAPVGASTYPLRIGDRFPGAIDEPRVSPIARTAVWIDAQWRSMNDTLLQFGPIEPLDG